MATKFYNTRKSCGVAKYPQTFHTLNEIVSNDDVLCALTGKQRARVIEFMYEQSRYGQEQVMRELL